jgi:hypothetical protein
MASGDNTSGRFAPTLVELLVFESSNPKLEINLTSAEISLKRGHCRSGLRFDDQTKKPLRASCRKCTFENDRTQICE